MLTISYLKENFYYFYAIFFWGKATFNLLEHMKILLSLVLFFWISLTMAQENEMISPCGSAEGIELIYDQQDFQGRFAVLVLHKGEYDYYVIDQTQLTERFEKIYFLNLAYSENRLISIDHSIDKDQLWIKSFNQNNEREVLDVLTDMKADTQKAFLRMTDAEKSVWLSKYDKFKNPSIHE